MSTTERIPGVFWDKGGATLNPMHPDFGAVGGGVVDDTAALQAAIDAGVALDIAVSITHPHAVSFLTLGDGARVVFQGAGRLVSLDNNTVLTLHDNVLVVNAHVDLSGNSALGVLGAGRRNFALRGTTRVYNALPGEAGPNNGGVVLNNCNDFVVDTVQGADLYEIDAMTNGGYRTLGLASCTNGSVGRVVARGADSGLVVFGVTDSYVGDVQGWDLTDNGLYIQDATRNLVVASTALHNVEEGVVLAATGSDANIHIGNTLVTHATNKGVTLRTGRGYVMDSVTLVESSFAQSGAAAGVDGLTVGVLRLYFADNVTSKPVLLQEDTNVRFGQVQVLADAPAGGDAIRLIDCDDIMIGQLHVEGIGGSPVGVGIRLEDGGSAVADPEITVGMLTTANVTSDYAINTDVTNVTIIQPTQRLGDYTIRRSEAATLQLLSEKTGATAGDLLARIEAFNSDASDPGVVGTLEWQADAGNGAGGQFIIRNDQGAIVARVPPNNGMSMLLPTSPTGLDPGMIWNDGGTVTVVA